MDINFEQVVEYANTSLPSSGVDLSQATISVEVDIGKRAHNRQDSQEAAGKGVEIPNGNPSLQHARIDSTSSESDHGGLDSELFYECMRALKAFASFHYKETIARKVGLGSYAASGVKVYGEECPGRNFESLRPSFPAAATSI
uniref:Uncharacterized protein n=1 Tax=Chenopodium quinoa TaxID=63459 RepID=A0A803MSX0_CHEQI